MRPPKLPSVPLASAAAAVLSCSVATLPAQRVDLAERYPATLDSTQGAVAHDWTTGPEHVWELRSFAFELGDQLRIETDRAEVVFGVKGTNVLWAVVLPERPGTIRSKVGGDGEHAESLWLRFHPALVGELFPARTVKGQGDPAALPLGKRVYRWKINSSWQAGNQPVVPWRKSIVLDAQTTEGRRRFFMADTEEGTVKYEPYFLNRALPRPAEMDRKTAVAAFDAVWEAFDREYAMFGIKDVDWKKARAEHRKAAAKATDSYRAAAAIAALVAELEDLHAWVMVGEEFVPGFTRERPLNASIDACRAIVGGLTDTKHDILWGRTDDGIGYVNVHQLNDEVSPKTFDDVLEQLADTWALVVDLRFNGGGDELLARELAGRFLDQPRVYSTNRYRDGPKHDQLGPVLSRECAPRGPWRYESPVVVLQGRRTMSSAESFLLMLAQAPQVTTMGDHSAGSSGNPRRLQLDGDIRVNLPRWIDMDPDGHPIETVGVAPDVPVAAEPGGFTKTSDPVLQAALARLRETPEAERRPGRR